MTTDKTPPARPIVTLACVGKKNLSDGKIGIIFREIAQDGSLGAERIYQHKGLNHLRVGAVYEVEIDSANPRSIFTNTFRWLRLHENSEEAALWQLAADAFDTRHMAAQQEKEQKRAKTTARTVGANP